jgi:tetratricopeptide (TPR) repeat protein
LGRARGDTADYRRAIEQYGQAVELDPEMDKTRFRMCVLRFQLDALPDAVAYFAEVVRRSPNDAEARHYYGRALQRAGRHEEAREQLARAAALLNRG